MKIKKIDIINVLIDTVYSLLAGFLIFSGILLIILIASGLLPDLHQLFRPLFL